MSLYLYRMNRSNLYDFLLEQIRIKDSQNEGLNQLVSSLVEKIEILEKTICSYEDTIKELRDTINLLNKKLYGSKSEKSHSDDSKNGPNGCFPNYGGTLSDGKDISSTKGMSKVRKAYKRPERRTYDDIEERIEILEPDAEELKGAKFVRSEKTFRLYMIPAKIVKVIYDRRIYSKDGHLIMPRLPYIPEEFYRRHADPSLMAGILTNKYLYHLPIHRQLKMFVNAGAKIARSTLYDWCGTAIDALEGLYHSIKAEVLKGDYLNIDETTVSVIDEDARHVKKEYMWGLVDTRNKLTFFAYEEGSRSRKVISSILEGYIGTIQTDGYSAYKSIGENDSNKIRRLSCLSHVRRKFLESRDNDRETSDEALHIIDKIYRLEKFFRKRKFSSDEIRKYRIRFTVPLFRKFRNWLETSMANPKILDESLIGKALSYAYREFKALTLIFDDGYFKADNNAAERAMRPCKLGMNNYLFFGNHESARRGAIIYTIIESCKLNGINMFEYLTDVFSREPQPGETYDMFLPNKWNQ
jgi:transposase